jgi:hypothetical protein
MRDKKIMMSATPAQDNNELLTRVINGDQHAFKAVLKQNQQFIFSVAMQLTHSNDSQKMNRRTKIHKSMTAIKMKHM